MALNLEEQYPLKENLSLPSSIGWASLNGDFQLDLAMEKSPGIILSNSKGKQIGQIGSTGRGPSVYSKPAVIKFKNNLLYL